MNIKDFFETNGVYLELSELFDELKEEKSKSAALKSALNETLECYEGEEGERIIVRMSAYYLALTNSIKTETYRTTLDKISAKKIREEWADDADTIIEVLEALLNEPPVIPEKKKTISTGKLGSKNWKAGDLYAYRLKSDEAKSAGLYGKYVIIYCVDIKKVSAKRNDVICYLWFCFDEELPNTPETVLEHSACLPFGIERKYLCLFFSPHSDYPDDEITYIGNSTNMPHPKNEFIPPNELFYPWLCWNRFEKDVIRRFNSWKKYGEGQEIFLK